MFTYKGNCEMCDRLLIDYDLNYKNGQITLCNDCYKEYCKHHHVIVQYCPTFVEDGGDKQFYNWESLTKFLEDYPTKKDWEYRLDLEQYTMHGRKQIQGSIMMYSEIEEIWYVVWMVHDPVIIEEL